MTTTLYALWYLMNVVSLLLDGPARRFTSHGLYIKQNFHTNEAWITRSTCIYINLLNCFSLSRTREKEEKKK